MTRSEGQSRTFTSLMAAGWFMLGAPALALAQDDPPFMDCDDGQIQRIEASVLTAGFQFIGAGNDLTSVQQGGDTSRFDRWFGGRDPDAVSRVADTLLGAYNALGDVRFDCGCNIPPFERLLGADESNVVAWCVHNASDHLIHLCPLFFSLDANEFGVGTLIHELTHFYGAHDPPEGAVCAAPDNLGPVEIDRKLASEQPAIAVDNADNYRYYVLDWAADQPSSYTCPPLD